MNKIYTPMPHPIAHPSKPTTPKGLKRQESFGQILGRETAKTAQGPVKFSKHAEQRLENRAIHLTEGDRMAIDKAVDSAARKGIRDSLIVMKNMAFIVNVPSRVVVTAVDGEHTEENVFTNIDGAVIL